MKQKCVHLPALSQRSNVVSKQITSLYSESQRSKHPELHGCSYKNFWVNSAIVSVTSWPFRDFRHSSDCWNVSHKRDSLNVLQPCCVTTSKCLKAFRKRIISGVKLPLVVRYWKLFHRLYWHERDLSVQSQSKSMRMKFLCVNLCVWGRAKICYPSS